MGIEFEKQIRTFIRPKNEHILIFLRRGHLFPSNVCLESGSNCVVK